MQLAAYQYTSADGWSLPLDGALDSPQTLVLIFGPAQLEGVRSALKEVCGAFPNSVVLGCSSAGEIHQDRVYDDSLSVSVTRFAQTRLQHCCAAVGSAEDSVFAGKDLAFRLQAPDLRAVLVLSEGLAINGTRLAEGFHSVVGNAVVVTGGLAGDGPRFQKTWVLHGERILTNRVVAVAFYGDAIEVAHGSRGGWTVRDTPLRITHAIGNRLYELNHEPALSVYRRLIGDLDGGLTANAIRFPLALPNEEAEDQLTVRTVLAVDEVEESLTFAGSIPEEGEVKLMSANLDELVEGAGIAAQRTQRERAFTTPVLAIAISCVGRRLVLEKRTDEELRQTLAHFPEGSVQVGFYSYGEISPLLSGRCALHNQTMTLTVISERD